MWKVLPDRYDHFYLLFIVPMAKHGKKYVEASKLVDSTKIYALTDAVDLLKKTAYSKFK